MSKAGPLKCITGPQLKALHAIARRRGWTDDDLHAIAGVTSLRELGVAEASALIDDIQTPGYRKPDYEPPPPDRASCRGAVRLATTRQRNYIALLCGGLGWTDEAARRWLRERYDIRDLAAGAFSTKVAAKAVNGLLAIQRDRRERICK